MKRLCFLITLVLGFSAAAFAQGSAAPRVYQLGEITYDRYTVLERIWVGSWRTVFQVPGRADEKSAVEALMAEAARLGADGIVNLHCVNDNSSFIGGAEHFCYANAIKLK